jgi:endonuclease III
MAASAQNEAPSLAALQQAPLYSEELGIRLETCSDEAIFKWFLASVLMGARISEQIAKRTFKCFEQYNLTTPAAIQQAGWAYLVNPVLREGGYRRYDEKTATTLLQLTKQLQQDYNASLNTLHEAASSNSDLERRLKALPGVGPTTVNIFLREMRHIWPKCHPRPNPMVRRLAAQYGLDLAAYDRNSRELAQIEAGLFRYRKVIKG